MEFYSVILSFNIHFICIDITTLIFDWDFFFPPHWVLGEWKCCKLNVCDPPKFICWNLISSVTVFGGGAFGRWLDHENQALMNRISALYIKESPESSLAPSAMWGHCKRMAVSEPGSRLSSDTDSSSALILYFPVSRTVRLFKPPSLGHFC